MAAGIYLIVSCSFAHNNSGKLTCLWCNYNCVHGLRRPLNQNPPNPRLIVFLRRKAMVRVISQHRSSTNKPKQRQARFAALRVI